MTKQLDLSIAPAKHYYDTTHVFGRDALIAKAEKCSFQEREILALLRLHNKPMSPSRVAELVDRTWPLTSIRRAMTNLTKRGLIVKLPETVIGVYGHPEHCWGAL